MEEHEELSQIMKESYSDAKSSNYEFITPEQVLLHALGNVRVLGVLESCQCDIPSLKDGLEKYIAENVSKDAEAASPIPSVAMKEIYSKALDSAIYSDRKTFDIFDFLVAMICDSRIFCSYMLKRSGVDVMELMESISDARRLEDGTDADDGLDEDDFEDIGEGEEPFSEVPSGGKRSLARFAVDMTSRAEKGMYDSIIGRGAEIERTIEVLCRRTKNNPIHVGDAGVGKTAIAEGLAQRIVAGNVPERLRGYKIYSIEMSALLAGTKFRGDFESRIRGIIEEIEKIGKAVLYIDEIHTIVGSGAGGNSPLDMANILKPALSRGNVRVMGATTFEEYTKFIEKNRALSRRFQKIDVLEPSRNDAVRIVRGIKERYEEFHGVAYNPSALSAAVDLSVQYLPDRRLPDKAIDVIDEAGVFVSLNNERRTSRRPRPRVSEETIRKVVAKMARVPVERVGEGEKERLRDLEGTLRSRIFGQDEAVSRICVAVKKARAGFRDETKPEASFLFVGPTGVGKTELAKSLGDTLGLPLVRFDMSEYQESYTVSRLIGSAPGYVGYDNGGLLTAAVKKSPHSIVLFDEIEKAHQDIYNILLQVLDYGTLTDNQGQKADFRNCIIIFTSNAGARDMEKGQVGFDSGISRAGNDDASVREAVAREFPPEFRNRLDGIVVFRHLGPEIARSIARKAVGKIAARLSARNVRLSVSDDAVALVAEKGYSREFGARNISREADSLVASPLVDEVLFGRLSRGGEVEVSASGGKMVFSYGK